MKLGYWGIQGLAQPIRYLLKAQKIEHEEQTYMDPTQWFAQDKPAMLAKGETSFPNLPYLVTDSGLTITQSSAIMAYLARQPAAKDLNPANYSEQETIQIDVVNGVLTDFWSKWMAQMFNKEGYEASKKKFHDEILAILQGLDQHLAKHKFSVGEKISWVDFKLYHYLNISRRYSGEYQKLENLTRFLADLEKDAGGNFAAYVEESNKSLLYAVPGLLAWGCCPPSAMEAEKFE